MQAGDCVYVILDGKIVATRLMERSPLESRWIIDIDEDGGSWSVEELYPDRAAVEVALRERQGDTETKSARVYYKDACASLEQRLTIFVTPAELREMADELEKQYECAAPGGRCPSVSIGMSKQDPDLTVEIMYRQTTG